MTIKHFGLMERRGVHSIRQLMKMERRNKKIEVLFGDLDDVKVELYDGE